MCSNTKKYIYYSNVVVNASVVVSKFFRVTLNKGYRNNLNENGL